MARRSTSLALFLHGDGLFNGSVTTVRTFNDVLTSTISTENRVSVSACQRPFAVRRLKKMLLVLYSSSIFPLCDLFGIKSILRFLEPLPVELPLRRNKLDLRTQMYEPRRLGISIKSIEFMSHCLARTILGGLTSVPNQRRTYAVGQYPISWFFGGLSVCAVDTHTSIVFQLFEINFEDSIQRNGGFSVPIHS